MTTSTLCSWLIVPKAQWGGGSKSHHARLDCKAIELRTQCAVDTVRSRWWPHCGAFYTKSQIFFIQNQLYFYNNIIYKIIYISYINISHKLHILLLHYISDHEHSVLVPHCAKGTMRWWLKEPPRGHYVPASNYHPPKADISRLHCSRECGDKVATRGHHNVMAALLIAQSAISFLYLLQLSLTNISYKSLLQISLTNISYKSLLQIFITNFSYKYLLQILFLSFFTNISYKYLLQISLFIFFYKYLLQISLSNTISTAWPRAQSARGSLCLWHNEVVALWATTRPLCGRNQITIRQRRIYPGCNAAGGVATLSPHAAITLWWPHC